MQERQIELESLLRLSQDAARFVVLDRSNLGGDVIFRQYLMRDHREQGGVLGELRDLRLHVCDLGNERCGDVGERLPDIIDDHSGNGLVHGFLRNLNRRAVLRHFIL